MIGRNVSNFCFRRGFFSGILTSKFAVICTAPVAPGRLATVQNQPYAGNCWNRTDVLSAAKIS